MDGDKGYGGRPLWQWVLIYLVIGVALYALIYYFFIANRGDYKSPTSGFPSIQSPSRAPGGSSSLFGY